MEPSDSMTKMAAASSSSPRMELYQQTELRAFQVFHEIHMYASERIDQKDADKKHFNAVLQAATEQVVDIDTDSDSVFKNNSNRNMIPDAHEIQTLAIAHVCSHQILQQIGGPGRQHLPNFIVIQLLDLMTWIQFFQESVEKVFPGVSNNVNFKSRHKNLFDTNGDFNMENGIHSLTRECNMLWEVHQMSQDLFLKQTRKQADDWITNVYHSDHQTSQTKKGRLITSLVEDVISLAGLQLKVIRDRISVKSNAFVLAVCAILSLLREKHLSARNGFLKDFDSCCAATNDFQRMGEKIEEVVKELIDDGNDEIDGRLPEESAAMLEVSCEALVSLYTRDAVFAAQKACIFVFQPIAGAIEDELFGYRWEVELTHNELAMILIRTLVSKLHHVF